METYEQPKEEKVVSTPLSNELSKNCIATSCKETIETIKPNGQEIVSYEAPLTIPDMVDQYGPRYWFLAKHGFYGQGCGKHEQGIQVPLSNDIYDHSFGLGFNPYKQPFFFPNVNHIYSGSLKLTNPHLIAFDQSTSLDVFSSNDALADFLGTVSPTLVVQHKY